MTFAAHRRSWLLLAAFVFGLAFTSVAQAQWTESFPRALAASKKTGKPILANFTGSDWCGWCMKLEKDVFSKPEFKQWAAENVILLTVDFPRKSQPANIKKQNQQLKAKFASSVGGYPTVLLIDSDLNVLHKTGYWTADPGKWIEPVQSKVEANSKKAKTGESAEAKKDGEAQPAVAPKLAPSFAEGLEQAKATSQGLFILLEGSDNAFNNRKFDELLAAEAFQDAANRMVFVRLKRTGKEAADQDDYKAAEAYLNALKVRRGIVRNAVVLPSEEEPKLLLQANRIQPAMYYAKQLEGKLPEPAYDGRWVTDLEEGKQFAAATGKPMFVFFTGSDWCGWCIRLKSEVLDTDEFKAWAKHNVILVELDFPRKNKPDAKTMAARQALAKQYGVRGFPTVFLTHADGKAFHQTGYQKGGPAAYTQALDKKIADSAAKPDTKDEAE